MKLEISVIMSVYNGEGFVSEAIRSILAQSFSNFEFIIFDDGSTDHTQQLLSPFKDRIRYIYQENQERSAARNTGLRYAKGEFIAFLDADDYWLPGKLLRQVKVFEQYPEIDLVYSKAYLVNDTFQKLGITRAFFCKLHFDEKRVAARGGSG